jgi:dienelactone hydrolase
MCHDPDDASHAREATRIESLAVTDGHVPIYWFDPDALAEVSVRLVLLPDMRGPHSFYKSLASGLADEGIQTALLDYFWRLPAIDPNDLETASHRRMDFDLPKGRSDISDCLNAIKRATRAPS